MPSNQLRIDSKELFTDRNIFLTDHALERLNERLGLNKEKAEYSQYIKSMIYGTTKTFVTYKNKKIFVANIAFGEVDVTLPFTRTEDGKNYLLLTAFINSTSRFVEFMKKEYSKESRLSEVEQILKDSLFNGKSSEEFFDEFENKFGLSKNRILETNTTNQKHKKIAPKQLKTPKKVYSQELNESYMEELLNSNTLVQQSVADIVQTEAPISEEPYIANDDRETKIPEQKEIVTQELNDDFMKELLGDL